VACPPPHLVPRLPRVLGEPLEYDPGLSLARSLTHSLALAHTHTHTHRLSLSLARVRALSLALSRCLWLTLFTLAPLALVRADARPPALLASAPDALVRAHAALACLTFCVRPLPMLSLSLSLSSLRLPITQSLFSRPVP
jgi:hypothetical protein